MRLEFGSVEEVTKKRRVVVSEGDHQILVYTHEGRFYAMDNLCIHRQREMTKGVVLKGRLVCPGHQWAFDIDSGWESVKQQCQPVYDVEVVDGVVTVETDSRRQITDPPGI